MSRVTEIQHANSEALRAQERLTAAVKGARESGLSWGNIAAALGVSRQAAWERYKDYE